MIYCNIIRLHRHFGRNHRYPCTYISCPCKFKTWNALLLHLSRVHPTQTSQKQTQFSVFSCKLCACNDLATERDYFIHINAHLKNNETVHCMFSGCSFQTNINGTWKSHKNRKHTPYTLEYFKSGVVTTRKTSHESLENSVEEHQDDSRVGETDSGAFLGSGTDATKDLPIEIEQRFAAVLWKLEHFVHVPSTAIDEFLEELHHLISSASVTLYVIYFRTIISK